MYCLKCVCLSSYYVYSYLALILDVITPLSPSHEKIYVWADSYKKGENELLTQLLIACFLALSITY